MPSVVEGIGTWYYGKHCVHRRKDVCSFCNAVGELASYDTTLYFVVFFIPLFPLGRKRVLEECPYCKKHRVLPLAQWEAAKEADTARMLEALQRDPDDRETILGALGLAAQYQDETLFNKLAGTLAEHRKEDAAIQAQLGYGYSYFVRYAEAEQALRAALAVEDNADLRRDLALVLLKQLRPEEARPYLQRILDNRVREEAGLIYLLVEAYQARGLHREALEVMDQRDEAFPDLAADKDYKKQRKTSLRYQDSGRPVKPAMLSESGQAGYREGGVGARVAKIVGPALVLGLLAVYLGSALWIGQARKVYVVNGLDKAYAVTINGAEHTLPPGAATPLRVAEGEVTVEFRGAAVPLEPVSCRVETPFFSRPFANRTFVINPDQLALLVWEQAEYSEVPRPVQAPSQLQVGKVLHAFEGLDLEFAPFPLQVKAKKGQTVRKTRVDLEPNLTTETRLELLTSEMRDPSEQLAYARRWLRLDPDNVLFLTWYLSRVKDDESLAFLRPGLAERPVRVEWHRAYQNLMGKLSPQRDLRPEYEKLVQETKNHPESVYLLGRILDTEAADKFFRQAAEAVPPSPYAVHALGFDALCRGQFAEAVARIEQAVQLRTDNPFFQLTLTTALLGAGQFDKLLERLGERQRGPDPNPMVLAEKVRIYAAKGDDANAEATVQQALLAFNRPHAILERASLQTLMNLVRAAARNDVTGYLTAAEQLPDRTRFEVAFLRGMLRDATAAVDDKQEERVVAQHGLLFLAAHKAKNAKLAEEQWQKLLASLAKSDRHSVRLSKLLAAGEPPNADLVRRLPIDPRDKRVVLAAIARHYPEQAQGLLELARKLDFQRDEISLCLRKVLE